MSSNPTTTNDDNGDVSEGATAATENNTSTTTPDGGTGSSDDIAATTAAAAAAGTSANVTNGGGGARVMFGPEPPPPAAAAAQTPQQQQQQQQQQNKASIRIVVRPTPPNTTTNTAPPSSSSSSSLGAANGEGSGNATVTTSTNGNATATTTTTGGQQQLRINIRPRGGGPAASSSSSSTTRQRNRTSPTTTATSSTSSTNRNFRAPFSSSSSSRNVAHFSSLTSPPTITNVNFAPSQNNNNNNNSESSRGTHNVNIIPSPLPPPPNGTLTNNELSQREAIARHYSRRSRLHHHNRHVGGEVEQQHEVNVVQQQGNQHPNVHVQFHPSPGGIGVPPPGFPPPIMMGGGFPPGMMMMPPPPQIIPTPPQLTPQVTIMRQRNNGGNGGGSQVRIGVPPLMAQPVPYTRHEVEEEEESKKSSNEEQTKENGRAAMECSICFEYMEDPVGCGHCQQRFCNSCLQRVLSEEAARRLFNPSQRQLAPPPPPPPYLWPPDLNAKCPCCRSTFTPKDVLHDKELQKRISTNSDLITCPFPGCNERMKLSLVREHEANCPHMRMRCRYAPFGCTWVGPKKDLEKHDEEECAFAKLGSFVDLFRQMKVEHAHAIGHLQQQVANSNRLIHIQNNTIMMLQSRNPANILDVLHLAYIATCHPVRFLVTKDLWRLMYRTAEARAIIHNVLYLFPSFLLVARIFFTGIRHLLVLEYNGLSRQDDYIDSLDTILLSFSLTIIGVLNLVCFHLDDSSPIEWTKFHLRPGFSWPVVRDTSAVALAALHCACVEFDGDRTGVLVWFAVFIAATCMPRIVSAMLSRAALGNDSSGDNNDDESNVSQHASETRARSVVLFGIRYGFVTEVCGILSTLDAVLVLRLAKSLFKIEERFTAESSECFLSELSKHVLGYLTVARIAMIIATRSIVDVHDTAIGVLFAVGLLLVVNRIMHGLNLAGDYLGRRVSKAAAATAASMSRPGFEAGTVEKRMDGMVIFCTWLTFLGCIVLG